MEMRPIDANALLEEMKHPLKYETSESDTDIDVCMRIVENAPTPDYEPVIHAHWIKNRSISEFPICSDCNTVNSNHGNYCNYCGAKMDEEVKG